MRLALAAGMAFLAGATDAFGLAELHNLYVSFMSGNTTMLGVSLGGGDFSAAASIAGLIGTFLTGATGGAVIFNLSGRFNTTAVILAVSAMLCIPLVLPRWSIYAYLLAMGALNAAVGKVGSTSVALTYVTGALVKFGQGLGNWITGHRSDTSSMLQALMWASLLLGSISAAFLLQRQIVRPWPLPLIGLLLTVMAFNLRPFPPAAPALASNADTST